MTDFGRWPWSWPVEVPVKIREDDGTVLTLTEKGVFGDAVANVGHGYRGESEHPPRTNFVTGPIVLSSVVGRKYLRAKLRSGEWEVIGA
jgi:hypothetical protein